MEGGQNLGWKKRGTGEKKFTLKGSLPTARLKAIKEGLRNGKGN